MREHLPEILRSLPRRKGQALTEEDPRPGFSTVVTTPPGYVWPDLVVEDESAAQVLLVTAPGAMGKSAAAKAVARELGAPLVDLAMLRVGSNSLTGLLTQVLGWAQAPAFIQELRNGTAALVLDSADEAQLSAGRDNYIAFLEDLAGLLRRATPARQVVMLGRRDAVETTYLALAELNVSASRAEISPLTYDQSCELLNRTLDAKVVNERPYDVHRVHPIPFGQLRDKAFADIAQALEPEVATKADTYWTVAEPFLGYPPVLIALAERLAVENPQAELEAGRIATGSTPGEKAGPGQLLRVVVEGILDRESAKVRARVGDALDIPEDDDRRLVLYGRDEQVLRLLEHLSNMALEIAAPASLQPKERAQYDDLIEGFVPDHPFVFEKQYANIVFSDYVRAYALTTQLQVHGVPRRSFLSGLPGVGPFFAQFVSALAPAEGGLPTVAEDLVDDLIRSNALGAREGGVSMYAHRGNKANLTLFDGSLTRMLDGEPYLSIISFSVNEPTGVVELTSPLARCYVVTDHGVVVNGRNGVIEVGPSVVLHTGQLQLVGESVIAQGVESEDPSGGCLLVADEVAHEAELKVQAHPTGALVVTWPNPWHQWKSHHFNIPTPTHIPSRSSQAVYLGLRRILTAFHASAKGEPSAYQQKLERFAIGENPIYMAVFTAIRKLGIVVAEGSLYRLRTDPLAEFGVNHAALRGPDLMSALARLHAEVLKDEGVQRAARLEP